MNLPAQASKPLPCPSGQKTFEPDTRGRLWVQWRTTGPSWSETLNKVKGLQDRKFDPDGKLWSCRDNLDNRTRLLDWGFQLQSPTAPVPLGMPSAPAPREIAPWIAPWLGVEVPGDWSHLRGYQHEGLQFLEYRKGRGGIALEMGLGKTALAVSWGRLLHEHRNLDRIVVIATAATKHQWRGEARKWGIKLPVVVLSGKTPHNLPTRGIVVLNWEILPPDEMPKPKKNKETGKMEPQTRKAPLLPGWLNALIRWDPETVICDEFHLHIGADNSQRSRALTSLVGTDRGFVSMSGSPMRTAPIQLWTVLHLLDPKTFSNLWSFKTRYCREDGFFGTTYRGANHMEELHEKMRPLFLRYRKVDVLKDLPSQAHNIVELDCKVTKEYLFAEDRVLNAQGLNAGELKLKIQQLAASAFDVKKHAVIDWIIEFLDSGKKLILFAWHRSVVEYLKAHLGARAVTLNPSNRQESIAAFIRPNGPQVFLLNIQAGGVGIDGLQEVCSDVAFVEFRRSPSDIDQAISRANRAGQKDCVNAYYLIAPDTVDEDALNGLDLNKLAASVAVDGNKDPEDANLVLGSMKKRRSKGAP